LSAVSELASALNLVLRGKKSYSDVELKLSSVSNVGWAAEIVDGWNAEQSHPAVAVMTHTSADIGSSRLQCGTFCTCSCVIYGDIPGISFFNNVSK